MAPKRARNQGSSSGGDEEPRNWKSKALSTLPRHWQPILYNKKLQEIQSLENAIVAERWTELADFRNYGVVEGFERLGWLAALTLNDIPRDESKIYLDEIIEWMSTLERENGSNPPWTTRLTGTVRGMPMVLSVDSMRQIADFDTLEVYDQVSETFIRGDLKVDRWIPMLRELFDLSDYQLSETMNMEVKDLKPLPRLLMKIFTWNVVPRTSDKLKVRTADIRPLYALVTGEIKFPFCQLVMSNVWDSHENSKKTAIPHCHLLSQLLLRANVIGRNARPRIVAPRRFNRANLPKREFAFKETYTHYVLHDLTTGSEKRFPKAGAQDMGQGSGQGQSSGQGELPEFENYGRYEPGPAYPGRPATYTNWTDYERTQWDDNQFQWEEQRLRDRRIEQRMTRFEERVEEGMARIEDDVERIRQDVESMSFYQQVYHHDVYDWTEQTRHWQDYTNQRDFRQHADRQDFSTYRRTDEAGPSRPPPYYPEMNHPQVFPGQYRDHPGGATSSQPPEIQDPLDTRDLTRSLYESFFGPNP